MLDHVICMLVIFQSQRYLGSSPSLSLDEPFDEVETDSSIATRLLPSKDFAGDLHKYSLFCCFEGLGESTDLPVLFFAIFIMLSKVDVFVLLFYSSCRSNKSTAITPSIFNEQLSFK